MECHIKDSANLVMCGGLQDRLIVVIAGIVLWALIIIVELLVYA